MLNLRESLRMTIYTWVSRGLFERHKIIFMAQITFNLMRRGTLGEDNQLNEAQFDFLMRGPRKLGEDRVWNVHTFVNFVEFPMNLSPKLIRDSQIHYPIIQKNKMVLIKFEI